MKKFITLILTVAFLICTLSYALSEETKELKSKYEEMYEQIGIPLLREYQKYHLKSFDKDVDVYSLTDLRTNTRHIALSLKGEKIERYYIDFDEFEDIISVLEYAMNHYENCYDYTDLLYISRAGFRFKVEMGYHNVAFWYAYPNQYSLTHITLEEASNIVSSLDELTRKFN